MRQTLFRIPIDYGLSAGPLGEISLFGFGLLLVLWALAGAWWLWRNREAVAGEAALLPSLGLWLLVAGVIVLAPWFVRRPHVAAEQQWTQVIEVRGPAISALLNRGKARVKLRDFDGAAEDFERALKVDPDSVEAHRQLAWLRAAAPVAEARDADVALEHARQAADLTQHVDPESLDALAAAFAASGDYEQAVRWGREAAMKAYTSRVPSHAAQVPDIRRRLALYRAGQAWRGKTSGTSIPVFGYGFMLFLGFLIGGHTAVSRTRMARLAPPGEEKDLVWDLAMWLFFSGIIGARAFYLLQYHDRVFAEAQSPAGYLKAAVNLPDGGLVLYGGVLLGLAAFFVFCRRRGISPLLTGDMMMPAFFVGLTFGRLGCFLNGCCYGDRCELPWAVTFPAGSVPDTALVGRGFLSPELQASISLHPSQLYSSFNALVLALLTHFYFRTRPKNGSVIALSLVAYPISRFTIEYLRGDEMGQFDTTLTISQWVSLGMFTGGLLYSAWLFHWPAALWKRGDKTDRPVSSPPGPSTGEPSPAG